MVGNYVYLVLLSVHSFIFNKSFFQIMYIIIINNGLEFDSNDCLKIKLPNTFYSGNRK